MGEVVKPGWVSPGGRSILLDPVERGWATLDSPEGRTMALRASLGGLSIVHCNNNGEPICDEEADAHMFDKPEEDAA